MISLTWRKPLSDLGHGRVDQLRVFPIRQIWIENLGKAFWIEFDQIFRSFRGKSPNQRRLGAAKWQEGDWAGG